MNIIHKKYLSLVLIVTFTSVITGCANLDREKAMTYGGGLACGAMAAIGSRDWNIAGRGASIGIAGYACSQAGKWLSQYLDEREEKQAIEAAKEVLRNPNKKSVKWKSNTNTGVTGTATEIHTAQADCQDVEMLVFKDGKKHRTVTKFCTDPNSGDMVPV